jgi:hypothetical protein
VSYSPHDLRIVQSYPAITIWPTSAIEYPLVWPEPLEPGRYEIVIQLRWEGTSAPAELRTTATLGEPEPVATDNPSATPSDATAEQRTKGDDTPLPAIAVGIAAAFLIPFGVVLRRRRRGVRADPNTSASSVNSC